MPDYRTEHPGATMASLTKDQWQIVQTLFDALADVEPGAREPMLAASKEPADLIDHVRQLLAAHDSVGILDGDQSAATSAYSSLSPGAQVGDFVIDRLIGRGGMGEVYEARRDKAGFVQRAAIKMLRPEAIDQASLFDRERRLLAGLEHPGIARLIDGGIAPDGRPYMAMEFVTGQPIDQACAAMQANLPKRLALFEEACAAVSYAHARLIIHRDIKPSNIMVDDAGRVRLLDFGVARLLAASGNETLAMTQLLATPAYAAPEQLGGGEATIAADIYSLGIVLYELLVGRGPWQMGDQALSALMLRIVRDDPPFPSQMANADSPVTASALTGDLDAIIMKALRSDPADRYATVAEFADDVRRFLEMRPVRARSGSSRYLVGRFVRRYRWAVGASAAALVAILVGASGIAWQARATAIERDIAQAEARRSASVVQMLTVMLRDTATGAAGDTATVREMLDANSKKLVSSLDGSEESATLASSMVDLFINLDDPVSADRLVTEALGKGVGRNSAIGTAELKLRAATLAAGGRFADMPPLLDAAEAVFKSDPVRYRRQIVEVAYARAQYLRRTGDIDGAIALITAQLPDANRVYAENTRDLLNTYNLLAVSMMETSRFDEMPPLFDQVDAIFARTGEANSMLGLSLTSIKGLRLTRIGQAAAGEPILADVVARRRAAFGSSAALAVDMMQLARAKATLGKHAEARDLMRTALPMARQFLPEQSLPVIFVSTMLAQSLAQTGDVADAELVLAKIVPTIAALPPTAAPNLPYNQALAYIRLAQGRVADARTAAASARATQGALGSAGATFEQALDVLDQKIAAAR